MTSSDTNNGLVCFTNCLLALEDGSLVERDLWVDTQRGIILDAQRTFFLRSLRPTTTIDLGGNILSPGFIDIQINGAYDFDFSVYDSDDTEYARGLEMVSRRIVETGVTSLLPTIITQRAELYPKLLSLLHPYQPPNGEGATLLGWHAEGPFLQPLKRGAHNNSYLLDPTDGFTTIEHIYGPPNVAEREDWDLHNTATGVTSNGDVMGAGVRMLTIAPELHGALDAIPVLARRGVIVSIGHSIASADVAMHAVASGASLITHLFNAMPQLHHRDPGIIGLLGASPAAASPFNGPSAKSSPIDKVKRMTAFQGANDALPSPTSVSRPRKSEALDENATPPDTPIFHAATSHGQTPTKLSLDSNEEHDEKIAKKEPTRPYYGLIVDGVHSHPNSVRLAYTAHKEGCILITDAQKVLDPHMHDGVHEWRDGTHFVKKGDALYIEGTDTLAGSVVTLNTCVRNFVKFTTCTLGEAIRCATYNPAKCLGIENKKGTLRAGADADLILLDRSTGLVQRTWISGREVWTRERGFINSV